MKPNERRIVVGLYLIVLVGAALMFYFYPETNWMNCR